MPNRKTDEEIFSKTLEYLNNDEICHVVEFKQEEQDIKFEMLKADISDTVTGVIPQADLDKYKANFIKVLVEEEIISDLQEDEIELFFVRNLDKEEKVLINFYILPF